MKIVKNPLNNSASYRVQTCSRKISERTKQSQRIGCSTDPCVCVPDRHTAIFGSQRQFRTHLGRETRTFSLRNQQVRQSEHRLQLRRFPGQSPVARHLMAEDVLDNVKRVIDLGTHTGLEHFKLLAQTSSFRVGQSSALAWAQRNVPLYCARL